MKKIIALLFALIILNIACEEPSVLGHWKCDETGTLISFDQNGQKETGPVKELYEFLKSEPIEFIFHDDGRFENLLDPNDSGFYFSNHQGEKNNFLIRTNNGKDENLMTIKSVTTNLLVVELNSIEDEMIFNLNMYRVN